MLQAEWLSGGEGLAAAAAAWDRGVVAAEGDNPFVRSEFLLTWRDHLAPGRELRVLALREEGRIVAGLPLYRQRRRHGGVAVWALRPLGLGFANLTEPFAPRGREAEAEAAMLAALDGLPGWTYLSLPRVRAPWFAGLRSAPAGAAGHIARHRFAPSPNLADNLRRARRRAEGLGAVAFVEERDPRGIEAMVAFQLRHNGPDRYPPEREVGASRARWAGFTRALLLRLAADGHLDAAALRVGGELAAVDFGYRFGAPAGGHKSMLTSFDPRFARCSPGSLLLEWLISTRSRVDLYADADEFDKRRWHPERVPLRQVWHFAPTPAGRLLRGAVRLRRQSAKTRPAD